MATQVPIQKGLFTWPSDDPRLIGSECASCGAVVFPAQQGCPRCTSDETHSKELAAEGTLWTWTIQGFPPKAPPYIGNADADTFEAFGVGYVELPGQVKVEARLTEADPDELKIGMPMKMVVIPLTTNDDGDEVVTFAFAPADNAGGS